MSGELDTPKKGMLYASIPLVCGKTTLNFPISDTKGDQRNYCKESSRHQEDDTLLGVTWP
jgi:hypothetical protein